MIKPEVYDSVQTELDAALDDRRVKRLALIDAQATYDAANERVASLEVASSQLSGLPEVQAVLVKRKDDAKKADGTSPR